MDSSSNRMIKLNLDRSVAVFRQVRIFEILNLGVASNWFFSRKNNSCKIYKFVVYLTLKLVLLEQRDLWAFPLKYIERSTTLWNLISCYGRIT